MQQLHKQIRAKMNKRCLVIATVAKDGFYNTWSYSQSEVFDLIKVNFDPNGFNAKDIVFGSHDPFVYHEDTGFKHHIYKRLIEQRGLLDKYDWIWMPDYDVHLKKDEIERMFKIAQDYNLNICQPSLTHDSYHSFPLVLNDPKKFIRYTNYVEVMCPLFKTEALKKVLWTFTLTYSGWAQDLIWARDLNYERLAIIDDIQAKHVKPVESQHWTLPNGLSADDELDIVIKLMGLKKEDWWPTVLGGIDKHNVSII